MDIGILIDERISDFHHHVLGPIINDDDININVFAINVTKEKSKWQKLKRNIRRGRGFYVFVMIFKKIFGKRANECLPVQAFCVSNNYSFIEITNPVDDEDIKKILGFNLDLLINFGGYGIIKEPLLSLSPHGILSYHHGDMRKYRGQPPAFWELYNGEKVMGVTVQKLSEGLDSGIPIVEKKIIIGPFDTLKSLKNKAYSISESMMLKAIKNIGDPLFEADQILTYGSIYTLPNFRQWLVLYLKILKRRISFFLNKEH